MSTVRIGGTEFHHSVRGQGSPLLLVAGTGYPGATWLLPELVDRLAERHTVLTFDHRGTGGTPGDDQPYSTRRFAADAAELLRVLDVGPAHVVGHSMGGRVAQWMALDAPELLRSLVLAATGSGGTGNPDQPAGLPLDPMVAMVEHGYRGYMERHIAATFFTPDFAATSPERVAWLVDAFWDHRPSLRDYLKHMSARQDHDMSSRLAQIRVPALVLVGDADVRRGPTGSHLEQSQYLAEHIPGATLQLLPGLSHGLFWQDPHAAVRAVVSWTARVDAGSPPASGHGVRAGGRTQ